MKVNKVLFLLVLCIALVFSSCDGVIPILPKAEEVVEDATLIGTWELIKITETDINGELIINSEDDNPMIFPMNIGAKIIENDPNISTYDLDNDGEIEAITIAMIIEITSGYMRMHQKVTVTDPGTPLNSTFNAADMGLESFTSYTRHNSTEDKIYTVAENVITGFGHENETVTYSISGTTLTIIVVNNKGTIQDTSDDTTMTMIFSQASSSEIADSENDTFLSVLVDDEDEVEPVTLIGIWELNKITETDINGELLSIGEDDNPMIFPMDIAAKIIENDPNTSTYDLDSDGEIEAIKMGMIIEITSAFMRMHLKVTVSDPGTPLSSTYNAADMGLESFTSYTRHNSTEDKIYTATGNVITGLGGENEAITYSITGTTLTVISVDNNGTAIDTSDDKIMTMIFSQASSYHIADSENDTTLSAFGDDKVEDLVGVWELSSITKEDSTGSLITTEGPNPMRFPMEWVSVYAAEMGTPTDLDLDNDGVDETVIWSMYAEISETTIRMHAKVAVTDTGTTTIAEYFAANNKSIEGLPFLENAIKHNSLDDMSYNVSGNEITGSGNSNETVTYYIEEETLTIVIVDNQGTADTADDGTMTMVYTLVSTTDITGSVDDTTLHIFGGGDNTNS